MRPIYIIAIVAAIRVIDHNAVHWITLFTQRAIARIALTGIGNTDNTDCAVMAGAADDVHDLGARPITTWSGDPIQR